VSTLTLAPLALDRVDGEPTLDDLLMDVWEGLSVRRAVRCPVCAGEMRPAAGRPAGARPAGARGGAVAVGHCTDCGATLS
jgi:hypothetical protein